MLVFQQQPPPLQRLKPNPTPKRVQERQGHAAAAAAAAAAMFACSVAAAHAAQHAASSYSLGIWSTANLSVARAGLAATSLPNLGVAIFAGGASTGACCHVYFPYLCQIGKKNCLLCRVVCGLGNGMLEWAEVVLLIACASLMPCAVDGPRSNTVDIFNVTSGAWSTAALSEARAGLAATSLPNQGLAIFAGGWCTCCHVCFRIFACCGVRVGDWDA
jgi:hypothetical protein